MITAGNCATSSNLYEPVQRMNSRYLVAAVTLNCVKITQYIRSLVCPLLTYCVHSLLYSTNAADFLGCANMSSPKAPPRKLRSIRILCIQAYRIQAAAAPSVPLDCTPYSCGNV